MANAYVKLFNAKVVESNGNPGPLTFSDATRAEVCSNLDFGLMAALVDEFRLGGGGSKNFSKSEASWGAPWDLTALAKVASTKDLVFRLHRLKVPPFVEAEEQRSARVIKAAGMLNEEQGFNGWVPHGKLGQGGQGAAYRATHSGTGRVGALKVLLRPTDMSEADWDRAVARSRREAEVLSKTSHPCVLRVLERGENEAGPWIVSELHELGSLFDVKDALKGDSWRVLRLARDVASALGVMHAKGVVHRDVKPKNIFLRNLDEAVLGDFGIVHLHEATQLTASAEKVGAQWFRPPEAEEGRLDAPEPNFDVYSLGKVIYWCLSGGRMFRRERFDSEG